VNQLTTDEREAAVRKYGSDTFPHCDAYESACNCDLCREDDMLVLFDEVRQ